MLSVIWGIMDPVHPKEKRKREEGIEWWEVEVVRASFEVLMYGGA